MSRPAIDAARLGICIIREILPLRSELRWRYILRCPILFGNDTHVIYSGGDYDCIWGIDYEIALC